MDLQKIAEALQARIAGKSALGGTVKFNLGSAGSIYLDGSGTDNIINTSNALADCTVSMSEEDFSDLMSGQLDPTTAFMQGKMKVDGDMGVAMKLSRLV